MSREIILYIATSLDGFIAKENDDLQWLEETEGEGDAGYSDMYQSIDTIIMGKRTYDYRFSNGKAQSFRCGMRVRSDTECY
ncbi:dihydrofolate reductase [Lysinibacillus sp. RC46]